MIIVEILERKAADNLLFQQMIAKTKELLVKVNHHNNQITTQMSDYDIHNEEHSKAVLDIISQLLGDQCEELSFYELMLIWLSAYLHDSAMALPNWEFVLLRGLEGTDQCSDNTLDFKVCNDFRPAHSYTEAKNLVLYNKEKLYGSYEQIKDYVFVADNEATLIHDLAVMICEYEKFRNQYSDQLKNKVKTVSDYQKYSKYIRAEYIRSTHHIRVERNINNLKKYYVSLLGNINTNEFFNQLAFICRSHGETVSYILKHNCVITTLDHENINVSFIAQMLRLGDIIHFEASRAPLSLLAEKGIFNEVSLRHWKAKSNELTFKIERKKGKIRVIFISFCKSPDNYYFIHDYIDWIDLELKHYFLLKEQWEKYGEIDTRKYDLPLETEVDRSHILADKTIFIPDRNMKFVLEQSKILELLTGIQLYQNKYLCLREIYQNAYDATKCMIAENSRKGITADFKIQFGMGKDNFGGQEKTYIYCLDHGIGMDSYVINHYLLCVGKSYYRSNDFAENNIEWNNEVKPVSQFGIGLLSGYMIADSIGVTTKSYHADSDYISFILEGVNEHFYYIPCNMEDKEKIGDHGTLVKLYLKESESKINNKALAKYPLMLLDSNQEKHRKWGLDPECENNLLYLVSRNIGIENKDISVWVENASQIGKKLIYRNEIFDYRKYDDISIQDLDILWQDSLYFDGTRDVYKTAINMRDNIEDYQICIKTENIELYALLPLPNIINETWTEKVVDYYGFVNEAKCSVFVDGIPVSDNSSLNREFRDIIGINKEEKCLINFYGAKRPVLSVDRNKIVEMPDYENETLCLRESLSEEIASIVTEHIGKISEPEKDKIANAVLGIVLREYPLLFNRVMEFLGKREKLSIIFPDKLSVRSYDLKEIFEKETLELEQVDFRNYKKFTRQILIYKLLNAKKISLKDGTLLVEGAKYNELPSLRYHFSEEHDSRRMVCIRADVFDEAYAEYDLISKYWPITSPQLFDAMVDEYDNKEIYSGRSKLASDCSNSVSAIAMIDPLFVDPKIGILQEKQDHFNRRKVPGVAERIQNEFWLYELSKHNKEVREKKQGKALFAYISPREILSHEKEFVEELRQNDDKRYKGITEGWSILFLGTIQKYVIVPGKASIDEMIEHIPEYFRKMDQWIAHYLPNGTVIK